MEQVRKRDSKCLGDLLNILQTRISLSPLDPSHVGPIQTAQVGESFLRHAQPGALGTDGFSKSNSDVLGHDGSYLESPPLICPRTISIISDNPVNC